jgi:hypothetical protein
MPKPACETGVLELLGGGFHLVERLRRVVRIEPGALERPLVVIEHRVRHVERHRPELALHRVVVVDPFDVVGQVVLLGVDARLRREHRLRVDHLLEAGVLDLDEIGEVTARQTGPELVERVRVRGLVDDGDTHVVLRRVEPVGEPQDLLLVGALQPALPVGDLDRLALGVLQRVDGALPSRGLGGRGARDGDGEADHGEHGRRERGSRTLHESGHRSSCPG